MTPTHEATVNPASTGVHVGVIVFCAVCIISVFVAITDIDH